MRKKLLSLCMALALCLGLLPAAALAADGDTLRIGNTTITESGYWTPKDGGKTFQHVEAQPSSDGYIYYDPNATGGPTLTLNNVTISGTYDESNNVEGTGIYMSSSSGSASLTIVLQGDNNQVSGAVGIYVYSSSTFGATLNITGKNGGSLDASGSGNPGIKVQSNGGDASLTIQNADVEATVIIGSNDGVTVQAGEGKLASLTVVGGSLTATGGGNSGAGICYTVGNTESSSGTPSLTVSENAMVKASGSAGGITSNSSTVASSGTGIVFNNGTGTVYGSVELQENLTIESGQSLDIPSGASLDTNGKTLTVDGGELTGNIPANGVVYKVTGVTLSETNLTLDVGGTATLTATVKPDNATDQAVTWSSAPDGIVAITPDATDSKRATITATGTGTAAITATVDGKSATCSVTVNAAATAPSITTQPQNTTVTEGQTASFSVAAAGSGTLTYQWQESTNNGTAWTDISGADSAAYTIENTTTGMNGYQYRCVVTNSVGTVTSRAGTLTVTAAAVPVTGVSLNKTGTSLYVGGTETLTATITPSTATNQNVTWESSDTSVATVRNGVVTAVGAGAAVITPPRTAA